MLLAAGIPGVALALFLLLVRKYTPKAIEAYTKAKAAEREDFKQRQEDYRIQSDKIIEVATSSVIAIQQATKAIEHSDTIRHAAKVTLDMTEKALTRLNESVAKHDKRAETVYTDVQRILEHLRSEMDAMEQWRKSNPK